MRILMLSDFYPPVLGGVEQHVSSLARALVQRNHEVAVATLAQPGLPAEEIDDGVRVHRLSGTAQRASWLFKTARRPWAPPFPDPELTWGLRRVVARERPDVVHGHDWLARSFLPLGRREGPAFVVGLHYYTLSCAKKSLVYRDAPCSGPGPRKCLGCASNHYGAAKGVPVTIGNWLAGAGERRAVDLFLPVSTAAAEGNGLLGSSLPYRVIPNFVPDVPAVPASALDLEPYLRQLPDGPFLLFVGDLRRAKGIDVLLAAYGGLRQAPPLVLIGKVWPETPTELPPKVIVLRDWPNRAVMAAWRRCLFGLVPSVWPEPFGIVLIEAMASGRPVVASRIGGIPDVVSDGETGLLVPPGDVVALRSAMARLVGDASLREHLGATAAIRAPSVRADAVVPRFEQAYEDALRFKGTLDQRDQTEGIIRP